MTLEITRGLKSVLLANVEFKQIKKYNRRKPPAMVDVTDVRIIIRQICWNIICSIQVFPF